MSENTIFVRKYPSDEQVFPVNEREVWRYSGYMGLAEQVDGELKNLLEQVKKELQNVFAYKVCFRRMEVTWENGIPNLPFGVESKDLAKCLAGSQEVVLFAATIGLEIDRFIAKNSRFAPTKALLMQAYGAERVECLCDVFCKELEAEIASDGLGMTARFSPGYGDLPLTTQVDMFRLLDCNRQIGISLNESLLMTPSKSVTAIVGLKKEKTHCETETQIGSAQASVTQASAKNHKCELCNKLDCIYRTV